jgi:hypothetical protein
MNFFDEILKNPGILWVLSILLVVLVGGSLAQHWDKTHPITPPDLDFYCAKVENFQTRDEFYRWMMKSKTKEFPLVVSCLWDRK